jgi:uncharacterized protein (DUF2252 family)
MSASAPLLSDRIHGKTVEERQAAGRAARQQVSRRALGEFAPSASRKDPVDIIVGQETDRVPALLPLRHQRMAANPFAFLRGAAAIMAADLGARPSTGLHTQLCGDAHLANLGIFAGPDRSLVFDINDFDETAPGPFEWDVLRLATSFLVAAEEAGHSQSAAARLPGIVATAYRDAMASFAGMSDLDIWYFRIDTALMHRWGQREGIRNSDRALRSTEAAARSRSGWSAVKKLTHLDEGVPRFNNQPPLLMSLGMQGDGRPVVERMFQAYKETLLVDRQELLHRYSIVDVGHKVVGVGSVGLLAFVILLQGRDVNDLLVLQAKQAVSSVLAPFTGLTVPTPPGRRVVTGQRVMQAASDAFLGWVDGPNGRSYYVRQLRDMKWSPDLSRMSSRVYRAYAALCGTALARAHARSGDAIAISSYLGQSDRFAQSVTEFAWAYSQQNLADYAAFQEAIASGRITAGEEAEGLTLRVDPKGNVVLESHTQSSAP